MQKIILRKTDDPYQPKKGFAISDEELEKMLKANQARLIQGPLYEEIDDPTEYETKVMTPKKKVASAPKRKRGRPRKTPVKS